MTITQHILQEIGPYLTQQTTVWVGYSGGLDSTVLLHALASISDTRFPLQAIHVNHQLSPASNHWQAHCEQTANALGVEIVCRRVEVRAAGAGLEHAAREARYAEFESVVKEQDILLCGHHADDQAETLMFRLVRGAGLRGLTAMNRSRALGRGAIVRPLLAIPRVQLESYAQQNDLRWVEDESNQNPQFDRNFLRHQVMPLIQSRWPGSNTRMQQTAQWLSEADALLAEYARADLDLCDVQSARLGQSLALEVLEGFRFERRKHVVRQWVAQCGFSAPDNKHLDQLERLIRSGVDSEAQLAWGQCEVRRFRQRLYLFSRLDPSLPAGEIRWKGDRPLKLPDGSVLSLEEGVPAASGFTIMFRQGGERCHPVGRKHSQTLKKLFQEFNVEPWLRDRVPLVYADGQIAAVGDVFSCINSASQNSAQPSQAGWQFSWRYPD
ncbi:tRNA(Ile)-lysidine synthase [Thalassocella blandensis]|nr:tRNA(Ile)-lysidine synthase [Thalassocella blandensis]